MRYRPLPSQLGFVMRCLKTRQEAEQQFKEHEMERLSPEFTQHFFNQSHPPLSVWALPGTSRFLDIALIVFISCFHTDHFVFFLLLSPFLSEHCRSSAVRVCDETWRVRIFMTRKLFPLRLQVKMYVHSS